MSFPVWSEIPEMFHFLSNQPISLFDTKVGQMRRGAVGLFNIHDYRRSPAQCSNEPQFDINKKLETRSTFSRSHNLVDRRTKVQKSKFLYPYFCKKIVRSLQMEESSLHISDSFLMIPPLLLFQLHCSSMLLHMLSTHMVSGIPNGNFQVRKNSNVINVPHSGQSIKQMLFLDKRRNNKNQIGILINFSKADAT